MESCDLSKIREMLLQSHNLLYVGLHIELLTVKLNIFHI